MRARAAAAVVLVCGAAGLAGCSGGAFGTRGTTGANQSGGQTGSRTAGTTLTGKVRGGQQPIAGAHVYLLAANTTGYGGNGIAASANNASVSLLTSAGDTALDTSGGATNGDYYVTTDASGNWTITGDYTCTPGQQVYLYAQGGDPGAGTNPAAGLMAALGSCPSAGNFATATPYIVINEVSTVATAYAFAGFATDATHVSSSGTTLAQTGVANAFANAANLETLSTGEALATTPAGNGTAPQSEINTLGNILASCVNSDGAGSAACTTLFATATADGTITGAQPTDTATVAINIAHNPGVNVDALYGLTGATPPFANGLTAAPNDWTVAIVISGGGLKQLEALAIDGDGAVWVVDTATSSITKIGSSGAFLSGASGYTGGGLQNPLSISIDPSGNAWSATLVSGSSGALVGMSSSGVVLSGPSGYSTGPNFIPTAIASDGSGNIWVSDGYNMGQFSSAGSILQSFHLPFSMGVFPEGLAIDGHGNVWLTGGGSLGAVQEVSSSGSVLSGSYGYTGGGIYFPFTITIDGSGDAWILDTTNCTCSAIGDGTIPELSNTGVSLGGSSGHSTPSMNQPADIAIDGDGNLWIASYGWGSVFEYTNTAVRISRPYYLSGILNKPGSLAVDGSGNVWVTNFGNNTVTEAIGVAAPVVTPLSVGVRDNKLGTRP
ncbi:MAG TPA: NHL repeat-containing protein [Acidobacteriaceae bacterium]|nr:NHL repeat-containing protein [Acidobacteriaceae bacterium]